MTVQRAEHWQPAGQSANRAVIGAHMPFCAEEAALNSVNMGTVWDRATEFLGDNIGTVTPIALAAIFVPASINDAIAPLGSANPDLQGWVSLASLILAVVSIGGQLAIMALALDVSRTAGEAARTAIGKLLWAAAITILLLFGLMLALIPLGIILVASGLDMAGFATNDQAAISAAVAQLPAGVIWASLAYLLAWAVGTMWFSARLTLAFPALVGENLGLGAIGRSLTLTKGLVLKIIGVLLLYVIVSGVAALAAKAAFGGVLGLIAGGAQPGSVASVLTSVAVGTVGTAFEVLQAAFVAKLFIAAHEAAGSR